MEYNTIKIGIIYIISKKTMDKMEDLATLESNE